MKMKKGMFFSLSVVVFLIVLFVVFKNKADAVKVKEESFMDRAQINVMQHFVNDFENRYVKEMLTTSGKQAFSKRTVSGAFPKNELADVMDDGIAGATTYLDPTLTTKGFFVQILKTLTFKLDKNMFAYTVREVTQTNPNTLNVIFDVSYEFEVGKKNWKKTMAVPIDFEVFSMWHPSYGAFIDRTWLDDASGPCYSNTIVTDAAPCTGLNKVPTWYVPPSPSP